MRTKAQTATKQTAGEPPSMIAWHVSERGERSYWTRIGAAWQHGDEEGLTVQLDLIPVGTGKIVLRVKTADDE